MIQTVQYQQTKHSAQVLERKEANVTINDNHFPPHTHKKVTTYKRFMPEFA